MREKIHDLFAIPYVIAAGDDFNSAGKKILSDARRNAESRGGIFAVGDAKINAALREYVREPVVDDLAPGRTYDVANEEDFQMKAFPVASLGLSAARRIIGDSHNPSLTLFASGSKCFSHWEERSTRPCAARP